MKHLQKLKDGRKRDKPHGQLATITYEVSYIKQKILQDV